MRVAMVAAATNQFARDWARAASEAGDVIRVQVVDRLSWPSVGPGVGRSPADGAEYQVRRRQARPTRYFDGVAATVTARTIDRCLQIAAVDHGPIDLLHTHFYATLRPICRVGAGVPFIHTEHSSALTGLSPSKTLSPRGLSLARRGFARARIVTCVSTFLAECIRQLGLPGQLRVIGNPIDVETFQPAPRRDGDRAVAVSRLERDKRIDLMLDALARAGLPDLHLEIIGDGPERSQLERHARRLGIVNRVSFTGRLPRDELAQRVASARLFISSAAVETFGVAVAEALSCGVPVIAPRVGALPELVGEADGALVDVPDADSLAAGIDHVRHHDFDPLAMRQRIIQRFSPQAVGMQLREAYTEAVAAGATGGRA